MDTPEANSLAVLRCLEGVRGQVIEDGLEADDLDVFRGGVG